MLYAPGIVAGGVHPFHPLAAPMRYHNRITPEATAFVRFSMIVLSLFSERGTQ